MTKTTQITPEQQEQALDEFKGKAALLDQDKADPACWARFLRARQWHVDKAVDMYNAYAQWRTAQNVDTVLDTPFAVDKTLWKHSFHGRDKQGRPIFIEPTGILDIKTIVGKGYKMDTLIRAHIYQQEYLAKLTGEATKREGRPIEQTLSILDLEGAGVWMHLNGTAREFFSALAGLAQSYYPERLYKLIVVNAPRAFPMAWNFIKPFLDVHTQNKIIIPHYKDQLKVLLEHVEPCFIPEKFGGQCKCEERGCLTAPNPVNFVDALRYDEGTQPNNSSDLPINSEIAAVQPTTTTTTENTNTTSISHSDSTSSITNKEDTTNESEVERKEEKGDHDAEIVQNKINATTE